MSSATHDVFLSHNSNDKPTVRKVQQKLKTYGIKSWLDMDELQPGVNWQPLLESGLDNSRSIAVFVGPSGIGPWQDEELQSALRQAVKDKRPVIPVLLRGAPEDVKLPAFLSNRTWVDLRSGLTKANMERLVWGITSEKPEQTKPEPKSSPTQLSAPIVSPPKLRHTAAKLFGRDDALARMDAAWEDERSHVVVIRAWGGVGKTSLVAEWMARLAADPLPWRGARRVFDWTFYSQGTRADGDADKGVSADLFIAEALAFFGDPDPQAGSPWDRGVRLAGLVSKTRSLLVLDGLEPLQHPPGPLAGQITDPAVTSLLKGLASQNAGLCVVTTRERVPDLNNFYNNHTAQDWPLDQLTESAGAELLHSLGVMRAGRQTIDPRAEQLLEAAREVRGHALTLTLMGKYLALALDGDIRKRDVFQFSEADPEWITNQDDRDTPYGHAFKVIAAYERWFLDDSPAAKRLAEEQRTCRRQLAVLRLLGLFNRPADAGCLKALREPPVIPGLTDELVGLSDRDWTIAVRRLDEIGLVKREPPTGPTFSLDAHPLLREFFAWRLKSSHHVPRVEPLTTDVVPPSTSTSIEAVSPKAHHVERDGYISEAFIAAQRRLYEYLCRTTEPRPATLAGLQPLYQAVAHGCLAGLQQEACADVYRDRILRGTGNDGFYSAKKLGAIGADLGAVACFFETPWSRLSPHLSPANQAWLLNEASTRLRALGRLTEALEPMRASLEMRIKDQNWKEAAVTASNLSELELTLGAVSAAVTAGEQAVVFADRSEDAFQRMSKRTTLADALHQAGCVDSRRMGTLARHTTELDSPSPSGTGKSAHPTARSLFEEAERLQAEDQPAYPRLYSLAGFRYCDLRLADAERAAWARSVDSQSQIPILKALQAACDDVTERASSELERRKNLPTASLLSIALTHLTLGRAALYGAILSQAQISNLKSQIAEHLTAAVDGLRASGDTDILPASLLTLGWFRFLVGDEPGSRADLDEAGEIAERGAMRLHQADIQLTRARLFRDPASLAAARQLIEDTGYGRRLPELADAEAAAIHWASAAK